MKTTIAFHGAGGSAEIIADPDVAIRIVRGALFAGGPLMAWYADGAWRVGDQKLERITFKGAVRVEFQGKAGVQCFGPLPELSLVGELAIGPRGTLARYDAIAESWHVAGADARSEIALQPLPDTAPSFT